jgi:nitrate reductase gamma subunit
LITLLYAVLLYAAAGLMLVGLAAQVARYARTPAPLRIPLMPAPRTRAGAVARLAREALLFESLFRSNKWLWVLGWTFHVALALVLLRHLRYFVEPVGPVLAAVQTPGIYAGIALLAAAAGLWARRFLVARVRVISTWSDHLMLALLAAIAASGLMMKYGSPTDVVAVKAFALGLLRLDWQPLPADPPLLMHLALVALLMALLPASKLVHAAGVFFSPTRAQPDDARKDG